MEIARGTTPTVSFKFHSFELSSIVVAVLKVKQAGSVKIERSLDTATGDAEEKKLRWKLTQEETLSLIKTPKAVITCDWKLADGTRGVSKKALVEIEDSGTDEVI